MSCRENFREERKEERRENFREERRESFREECREHHHNHHRDEVCVDGILFKTKLNEVAEGVCELIAVPCNQPTLVICVAEIKKKRSCCMNMTFFEGKINTHKVEMIQDCTLEKCIKDCIKIYIEHSEIFTTCNRRNHESRRNGFIF